MGELQLGEMTQLTSMSNPAKRTSLSSVAPSLSCTFSPKIILFRVKDLFAVTTELEFNVNLKLSVECWLGTRRQDPLYHEHSLK